MPFRCVSSSRPKPEVGKHYTLAFFNNSFTVSIPPILQLQKLLSKHACPLSPSLTHEASPVSPFQWEVESLETPASEGATEPLSESPQRFQYPSSPRQLGRWIEVGSEGFDEECELDVGASKESFPTGLSKEIPIVSLSGGTPGAGLKKETPNTGLSKEIPITGLNKESPNTGLNKETPNTGLSKEIPITGLNKETPNTALNKETPNTGLNKEKPPHKDKPFIASHFSPPLHLAIECNANEPSLLNSYQPQPARSLLSSPTFHERIPKYSVFVDVERTGQSMSVSMKQRMMEERAFFLCDVMGLPKTCTAEGLFTVRVDAGVQNRTLRFCLPVM